MLQQQIEILNSMKFFFVKHAQPVFLSRDFFYIIFLKFQINIYLKSKNNVT